MLLGKKGDSPYPWARNGKGKIPGNAEMYLTSGTSKGGATEPRGKTTAALQGGSGRGEKAYEGNARKRSEQQSRYSSGEWVKRLGATPLSVSVEKEVSFHCFPAGRLRGKKEAEPFQKLET